MKSSVKKISSAVNDGLSLPVLMTLSSAFVVFGSLGSLLFYQWASHWSRTGVIAFTGLGVFLVLAGTLMELLQRKRK